MRRTMKVRLLAMGTIISVLSLILLGVRGEHTKLLILLGVGIVLLIAGTLWRSKGA